MFDLDLFDDDDDRRRKRRRRRDDDDRGHRRDRDDRRWSRRSHRHLFAWVLLGGGVVLVALVVVGVISALGLWGPIQDAYFAATKAVLPTSWHDEWTALPGIAHVALGLVVLFVIAGAAGELLD